MAQSLAQLCYKPNTKRLRKPQQQTPSAATRLCPRTNRAFEPLPARASSLTDPTSYAHLRTSAQVPVCRTCRQSQTTQQKQRKRKKQNSREDFVFFFYFLFCILGYIKPVDSFVKRGTILNEKRGKKNQILKVISSFIFCFFSRSFFRFFAFFFFYSLLEKKKQRKSESLPVI